MGRRTGLEGLGKERRRAHCPGGRRQEALSHFSYPGSLKTKILKPHLPSVMPIVPGLLK